MCDNKQKDRCAFVLCTVVSHIYVLSFILGFIVDEKGTALNLALWHNKLYQMMVFVFWP